MSAELSHTKHPPCPWKFFLRDVAPPRGLQATNPGAWTDEYKLLVNHNSFDALSVFLAESEEVVAEDQVAPTYSQDSLDRGAVLWEKAVKDSFRAQNCYRRVRVGRRPPPKLSRRLRRRLTERRKVYRRMLRANYGSADATALATEWRALKVRTSREHRGKRQWTRLLRISRSILSRPGP